LIPRFAAERADETVFVRDFARDVVRDFVRGFVRDFEGDLVPVFVLRRVFF
jgi:hypothetical protein